MSILYRFRVIARFSSKVTNFNPPHLHLSPPMGVIPFEFRNELRCQKTFFSRGLFFYWRTVYVFYFSLYSCTRNLHKLFQFSGRHEVSFEVSAKVATSPKSLAFYCILFLTLSGKTCLLCAEPISSIHHNDI